MLPSVEQFWNENAAYHEAKAQEPLVIPAPQSSPMFNYSILFKNIEDRDSMSESELRYFIQRNFQAIMNNIFSRDTGVKYVYAFQDGRFLDAFIDVLLQMQFFDSDVIVRLNLLAYHYLTAPPSIRKSEISTRMLRIGSIVNRSKIISMKKFNLPENIEGVLLIARHSDFDLNICVKRVDLIINMNPEIFQILEIDESSYECPEQSIDYLARLLMELYKVEDWGFVLPYFMLDTLPDPDIDPNAGWVTPEVEAVDSAMSLAVLRILDIMIDDSVRLKNILLSYAEGYRMMNNKKKPRFSFQSLSEEYERLNAVVAMLEVEENIYVP